MPRVTGTYEPPADLLLGSRPNNRVPNEDQKRQRLEVVEILRRLRSQPGVILADEVGMGKTFVALAVAYSVATHNPRGPVIVMVPANLVDKWVQDLKTFCELYLENRHPMKRDGMATRDLTAPSSLRYGVARHSVELMKLLDDPPRERCHLVFLAQGAMARRQTDKWVRLALIGEALRRHGRGKAARLIQVKKQIHRFLGALLWAVGEERAHDWGDELWQRLLRTAPETWKDTYNAAVRNDRRRLTDDPVPKSVARALQRIDLKPLADGLHQMPVRARGGDNRVSERLDVTRKALRRIEEDLWKDLLARARWRSPLLIMDEAHHLKNPRTALARSLQSPDLERDLRTGDGAMANAFDRMLFLTATPFQLGHHELVRVLERFGDVRWDPASLGDRDVFQRQLADLSTHLDESQRSAIALQRTWSRLRPEDCSEDVAAWWHQLVRSSRESRTARQRAVVDAYETAKPYRDAAEDALRPWILRHNKGALWVGTGIKRRDRAVGAAILKPGASEGLPIPPQQLLPFFLAARSAVRHGQDLLGEALSSSYEAFRFTRQSRDSAKDEQEESPESIGDLAHSRWYLGEFDSALARCSGSDHPKVAATVKKVVDLWEAGEKVLVFAFYRQTCRALRLHISQEIERRIMSTAEARLGEGGRGGGRAEVERLLERTQKRYFDDPRSPGRRAVDAALGHIMRARAKALAEAQVTREQREVLKDVMRRFLRVATTLARSFPLGSLDSIKPAEAVKMTLDHTDISDVSWRLKFDGFIEFFSTQCSSDERRLYLEAARRTQTRTIRVEGGDGEGPGADQVEATKTLANVQVATGETKRDTRARLMRAFNTPFFPEVAPELNAKAEALRSLQRTYLGITASVRTVLSNEGQDMAATQPGDRIAAQARGESS